MEGAGAMLTSRVAQRNASSLHDSTLNSTDKEPKNCQKKSVLTLVPDFIGLPRSQLRYRVWFSDS